MSTTPTPWSDSPRLLPRDQEFDVELASRAVHRREFLETMAHATAAVSVVATAGAHGRYAQTVTAMCSVSAEPPTLLVCVNRRSPLADAAAHNGSFSVNILGSGQRELAECFAGRDGATPAYTFDTGWSALRTGAPTRDDACAAFDCVLVKAVRAGSHAVFFGQVVASHHREGPALTYGERRYGIHWSEPPHSVADHTTTTTRTEAPPWHGTGPTTCSD